MSKYEYVLDRLIQFRKSMEMTQAQMAKKLNISQEQYSYLENGKVKITAELLKDFNKMGLDINFLITGRNNELTDGNRISIVFEKYTNSEYKNRMIRLLVYLLGLVMVKDKTGNSEENKMQMLLEYLEKHWDDFSMISFVREQLSCSQITMADQLGLGIKKYRKLEKEIIYPDAELLFDIYKKAKYPPVLFLNLCDRKLYIIDLFWEKLTEKQKVTIKNIFNNVEQCCRSELPD